MKKRKQGSSLSRTKDQHDALLNTMLVSLVKYQTIKTTLAKAKELRPYAERMLTHAKEASAVEKKVAKLRFLSTQLPKVAVKGLVEQAMLFSSRNGGYTRIIKLPNRRSDASKMAMIEWVEKRPVEEPKKEEKKVAKKEAKNAAKATKKAETTAKETAPKEKTEATEAK